MEIDEHCKRGILHYNRKMNMNLKIYGFDTETCKGNPMTFQIYSEEDKVSYIRWFKDKFPLKELLNTIRNHCKDSNFHYVFFGHNLRFDLGILWHGHYEHLQSSKITFEIKSIKFKGIMLYGKVNTLSGRFTDTGLSISFIDTAGYFRTSLANLSATFCPNLPKLPTPKNIGERVFTKSDKNFIRYAIRDSEIAYFIGKKLVQFHTEFDVPLSISAPQFAARYFKKKYIPEDTRIPFPPAWIEEPARLSFHGGRNALWCEPGIYKDVTEVDINSAYPFAMTQIGNFLECIYEVCPNPLTCTSSIVKIFLEFQCKTYPNIYSHDFKIASSRSTLWSTGWELRAANAHGAKFKILAAYHARSDFLNNPLANYARDIFRKKDKCQDNLPLYYFYKVGLLNSLYGKFVETRPSDDVDIIIGKDGEPKIEKLFIPGKLYNPFVASQITGFTRSYLHRLEFRFNALHSSTDSILSQSKDIRESSGLGGLSIKCKGNVLLIRPKVYIIWDAKGNIIKSATHGFWGTPYQLLKMLKGERLEYKVHHMNQIRESARQGLTPLMMEERTREFLLHPAIASKLREELKREGI